MKRIPVIAILVVLAFLSQETARAQDPNRARQTVTFGVMKSGLSKPLSTPAMTVTVAHVKRGELPDRAVSVPLRMRQAILLAELGSLNQLSPVSSVEILITISD